VGKDSRGLAHGERYRAADSAVAAEAFLIIRPSQNNPQGWIRHDPDYRAKATTAYDRFRETICEI
jgi:hypothetical protein